MIHWVHDIFFHQFIGHLNGVLDAPWVRDVSCVDTFCSKLDIQLIRWVHDVQSSWCLDHLFSPWLTYFLPQGVQILKRRLAAKFTTQNDYTADVWEL